MLVDLGGVVLGRCYDFADRDNLVGWNVRTFRNSYNPTRVGALVPTSLLRRTTSSPWLATARGYTSVREETKRDARDNSGRKAEPKRTRWTKLIM